MKKPYASVLSKLLDPLLSSRTKKPKLDKKRPENVLKEIFKFQIAVPELSAQLAQQ